MSLKWTHLAVLPIIYILCTHLLHVLYFAGGFSRSDASLKGKTVVVTGANTGIGKHTAMDMAARGARVILACRSEKRAAPVVEEIARKTKNSQVLFMELDLSSFEKVQRFTDEFLKKESRLDILINNAGVMLIPEIDPRLSDDGIEMTMMVNHFGHFLLTRNLLNLIKKSGPGSRIVTVSSMGHDYANPNAFKDLDNLKVDGAANHVVLERATSWPRSSDIVYPLFKPLLSQPAMIRYTNSKLANVLFSKELAKRLAGSGVTTYSLHPGAILTELGVDRATGKDMFGMDRNGPLMEFINGLPDFFRPLTFAFKDVAEGAQTTICCAVEDDFANQSGLYYSDCAAQEVYREELNDEFTAKFWQWTEKIIENALKA